jgi:hypothetical protein
MQEIHSMPHKYFNLLIFGSLLFLTAFNLNNTVVPKEEIRSGGPPKDGIPAILNPRFVQADQADFLNPSDSAIGLRMGKTTKAYPIKILNWHEVVNDVIDGNPVMVTF